MRATFEDALALVLKHEGGFGNHPKDPGGATNKGITLRTYTEYRNSETTVEDLKKITDEEVAEIYRVDYWNACRCDELPAGVDYVVFDQAVNSGVTRSIRWLQQAVYVTVDGKMGPQTLAAVAAKDPVEVIKSMCSRRLMFLKDLQHWPTFSAGWTHRVAEVRETGIDMTHAAAKQLREEPPHTSVAIVTTPLSPAMSLPVTGQDPLWMDILKLLGLGEHTVVSLDLSVRPNDLVRITTTLLLSQQRGSQLVEFLQTKHFVQEKAVISNDRPQAEGINPGTEI